MTLKVGTVVSVLVLGFVAISWCQLLNDVFEIESKLDGKVLRVTDRFAPPSGGPYQRQGVVPVSRTDQLLELWEYSPWEEPTMGVIYSLNSTQSNSLTIGLQCTDCFSYQHWYNATPIAPDGARLLRFANNGIDDPNTCINNDGDDQFVSEVPCNSEDDSQLWYFRMVSS